MDDPASRRGDSPVSLVNLGGNHPMLYRRYGLRVALCLLTSLVAVGCESTSSTTHPSHTSSSAPQSTPTAASPAPQSTPTATPTPSPSAATKKWRTCKDVRN